VREVIGTVEVTDRAGRERLRARDTAGAHRGGPARSTGGCARNRAGSGSLERRSASLPIEAALDSWRERHFRRQTVDACRRALAASKREQ
jgi:hypothetical protein